MTTGYGGAIILGAEAGVGFGSTVAALGDLNGDGRADFAVAAAAAGGGYSGLANQTGSGQVFVIYGQENGLPPEIALSYNAANLPDGQLFSVLQGDIAQAGFGSQLAAAGDIDGDGNGDFLVGAGDYGGTGQARQGYILYGAAGGLGPVLDLATMDPAAMTRLVLPEGAGNNFALAALGDINKDGYRDVLVMDPVNGQAHILFGDGSRHPASLIFVANTATDNTVLQNVQAGFQAGDLNRDGYDDIALQTAEGLTILFGSAQMTGVVLDIDAFNPGAASGFDIALAQVNRVEALRDINGDGIDDLLIEGRQTLGPGPSTSYVIFGTASGFPAQLDLANLNGSNGFRIEGTDITVAAGGKGDVNGDGRRDFLVAGDGQAFLVFGQSQMSQGTLNLATLDGQKGYIIEGLPGDALGGGQIGDFNKDGFADLILALPGRDGVAIVYGGPRRLAALDAADGAQDGTIHLSQLGQQLNFEEPDPIPIGSGNSGNGQPTVHNDSLVGTAGDDEIALLAGDDSFGGLAGNDTAQGGAGQDSIFGDTGDDWLYGDGGNDLLSGGSGNDWLDGGTGADTIEGGSGHDVYVVGSLSDRIIEIATGGTDKVIASINWVLAGHFENLTLAGTGHLRGEGNAARNRLWGNEGNNALKGHGGDDSLYGGAGADMLNGGMGRDVLYLGQGADADRIVFQNWRESPANHLRDVVHDFRRNSDLIDLRAIDANTGRAGNQAFAFAGVSAQAYSVWWKDLGSDVLVLADVNGDAKADLQIRLTDLIRVGQADFLL